jgi:hypothetical protein
MSSSATLQPDLEFDNHKRHPKHVVFKCVFWPNNSFFSGDDWDVPKEEVKTYLMEHSSPLNLTILFSSARLAIVYVTYIAAQDTPRKLIDRPISMKRGGS